MNTFILEQCQILKKECEDYDDALNYVDDIVSDTMEKYSSNDIEQVRLLVMQTLKKVFNE